MRMADGPVANLPPGLDAYAGYVNKSGIGITYPQMVAKFPNALHLSITTNGSPAQCADVEGGAMKSWVGYEYGYCSVAAVNDLIAKYGRPRKLWTAHYDPRIGSHICSPKCWPGLVTTADGTQWIDHNGAWDESLLSADFFEPAPVTGDTMLAPTPTGDGYWRLSPSGAILTYGDAQYFGGPNTSKVNGQWTGPPDLLPGHTCVSIVAHPIKQGYWIEDNVGNLYAYGDAPQYATPN